MHSNHNLADSLEEYVGAVLCLGILCGVILFVRWLVRLAVRFLKSNSLKGNTTPPEKQTTASARLLQNPCSAGVPPADSTQAESEKCNVNTIPFKCPRCGIERETLDTPCLICNHTPEPQAKSSQTVTTQMDSSPRDVSTKTPAKTVTDIGHASRVTAVGWVYRNRKPIAVAVTVIVVALVAFAFKPRDHFYMVTDSRGQTFRIDKATGQTWRIQGSQMTEVEEPEPPKAELTKPLKALPLDEIAKLECKAGVSGSRDSISGQIYNGSSWDVSELTVSVTGKAYDGSKIWTRIFKVGFYAPSPVAPLSVGKFMFEVGDYFMKYDESTPFVDNNWAYNRANKLNDFDWNIEDAHGLPTE